MNLLFFIFSFKKITAQIAPNMGAVKLIAVASAKGILEMEKNQRYIAASATDDLAICSLIDLVFKLLIPEFNIHGKMKITAKKGSKKK